jgi:[acyl-carrier-protein] S-malonyltransferase
MSRAAVVFPGRGSYAATSLGSLPAGHEWVARSDELRAGFGLTALSAIDAADRIDPAVHLRPSNAWPLAFMAGLLDAERIAQDHDAVVVTASSTGWYTALAAAGVLDFDDAFRLVQRMALAADGALADGQPAAELVYPLTDEAWAPDPVRAAALDASAAGSRDETWISVSLGAFALVGGSAGSLDARAARLVPATVAGRTYPLRLPVGDGWHTPLRAPEAAAASADLADLAWSSPSVTLVDGAGRRHTPWSADPAELARITLEEHPVTRHDTATAVRVALREHAPDVLLLPGPGGSLGAACAHLVVAEGYRGIRSRDDFEQAQRSEVPILLSMRR